MQVQEINGKGPFLKKRNNIPSWPPTAHRRIQFFGRDIQERSWKVRGIRFLLDRASENGRRASRTWQDVRRPPEGKII